MHSFRPLLLMVFMFVFSSVARTSQGPQTSQATAALTNKDIVTMVGAGLGRNCHCENKVLSLQL